MKQFLNDWGLILVTFLPMVGVAVMLCVPRQSEEAHKLLALVTSLASAFVGVLLLLNFNYDRAGILQFRVDHSWIDQINSRFLMGVDGLSLPLLALTLLIVPLVIVYSWNHVPDPGNPKAFFILMLILETGMIGSFLAEDLILFFVFFEIVLLPMYFLIGVWGGPERKYASIKFFIYTLFGSALMIVSFVAVYFLVKNPETGEAIRTFSIPALKAAGASGVTRGAQVARLLRDPYFEVRAAAIDCLAQNVSEAEYKRLRPGVERRLRRGTHLALVVEQPRDVVERAGIDGLGHVQVAAGTQHARGLGERAPEQRQGHVVQRLQHQREVEARVRERDRLRTAGDEFEPRTGVGEVLRVLTRVDLQAGDARVRVTLEQRARQPRRAAAELDDAQAGQRHHRVEHVELVVNEGQGIEFGRRHGLARVMAGARRAARAAEPPAPRRSASRSGRRRAGRPHHRTTSSEGPTRRAPPPRGRRS